jgi:hypothetical protein
MSRQQVRDQAELLARENRRAEPCITKVYWFPHEKEVRLVELLANLPPSGDRAVPFYFRAAPRQDLPLASGIAMIRPEEFRRVELPDAWGSWDDAVELDGNGDQR